MWRSMVVWRTAIQWQLKLWNLTIEKMGLVALQPHAELEEGSNEVITQSLANVPSSKLPGQRLCAYDSFVGPGIMEPSLIITAAISVGDTYLTPPYLYLT